MTTNTFNPDYCVHPGATLDEVLAERDISQAEFADRTGRPRKSINEIIKGKAAITPETALQFEKVLGIPARFWNARESQYREFLARKDSDSKSVQQIRWAKQFPFRDMIKDSLVPALAEAHRQVDALLEYFGVVSPEQFEVIWGKKQHAYRKSQAFEVDHFSLAAWLRKGELVAQQIECADYDPDAFHRALVEARTLTIKPPEVFCRKLVDVCRAAGVAVVFAKELPRTRVSGATHWLSPKKALLQLSLRYKTDDHLWFTFFHEAGHILLHGKKQCFLEKRGRGTGKLEAEANRFGGDFLIPPDELKRFLSAGVVSGARVVGFARRIGIAPGIVVGRLQHDKVIHPSQLNTLKVRLKWAD
ncbi:MAG: helix-turn-helix domain-containing protein [Elusimicrobiota bacterium]